MFARYLERSPRRRRYSAAPVLPPCLSSCSTWFSSRANTSLSLRAEHQCTSWLYVAGERLACIAGGYLSGRFIRVSVVKRLAYVQYVLHRRGCFFPLVLCNKIANDFASSSQLTGNTVARPRSSSVVLVHSPPTPTPPRTYRLNEPPFSHPGVRACCAAASSCLCRVFCALRQDSLYEHNQKQRVLRLWGKRVTQVSLFRV